MSSKQTWICLTDAVYTKCENNCVCEKEATVYSHNDSAGFRNLKQLWFSWSSPVFGRNPNKGDERSKMVRAEIVYF